MSHENTLIYIEVPGIFKLEHAYNGNLSLFLQNAHLYHFSLRTLQNLMTARGFELVSGTEFIRSIFKFTNKYSNEFVSVYNQVRNYLEECETQYAKPINLMKYKLRKMAAAPFKSIGFISPIIPLFNIFKTKMADRL